MLKKESIEIYINRNILIHLLTGFHEKLKMGISIYFLDLNGVLQRIDPDGDKKRYWPHICKKFREIHDEKCIFRDGIIAQDFFNNPSKQGYTYFCDNLGLAEITVPIKFEGRNIAVMISGQRIINDQSKQMTIQQKIYSNYSTEEANNFIEALKKDINEAYFISDENDLKLRFNEVNQFGETISEIINLVGDSKEQILQSEFRDERIAHLDKIRFEDIDKWKESLEAYLFDIKNHLDEIIDSIAYYRGIKVRDYIKYDKFVAADSNLFNDSFTTVYFDFKESKLIGKVYAKKEIPREISAKDLYDSKYYIYPFSIRAEKRLEDIEAIVLIKIKKIISSKEQKNLQHICNSITVTDVFTQLYKSQLKQFEDFEKRVIDIQHDLKTSLQHVVGHIGRLLLEVKNSDSYRNLLLTNVFNEKISNVKRSFNDHIESVVYLSPDIMNEKSKYCFTDLLLEQIDLYEVVASQKQINFDLNDFEKGWIHLFCNARELKMALAALIENAIKYSFKNQTIKVSLKHSFNKIVFSISNIGIGIPPHLLNSIRERHFRGNIVDVKAEYDKNYEREGTGLGLSIVSDIFQKNLKGEVKIESDLVPWITEPKEPFHNYLTKVTVIIPN